MKKTKNTKKEEVFPSWLFGGNPNAIEAQEAAGQQELIASQQLPKRCNNPHGVNATEQYTKMGIKVFTVSKGDDLFVGVKLPDGWKKEATDHSMWNKLIDDKGRVRATFFYKAAFYDRDSFVNFQTRYQTNTEYPENEKHPTNDWDRGRIFYIEDKETGKRVWESEKHFYEDHDKWYTEAMKYFKENLPDWKDINAYWS